MIPRHERRIAKKRITKERFPSVVREKEKGILNEWKKLKKRIKVRDMLSSVRYSLSLVKEKERKGVFYLKKIITEQCAKPIMR